MKEEHESFVMKWKVSEDSMVEADGEFIKMMETILEILRAD